MPNENEEKLKANEEPKKEKAPLGERIEDTMEDIMETAQDLIYGPKTSFTHDIPAMQERPSGIRKINKVQTRRNIFKRCGGKTYVKILLIILAIGLLVAGIRYLIMTLLMA